MSSLACLYAYARVVACRRRDQEVCRLAEAAGVHVACFASHTLHDPEAYMAKCKGKVPVAYQSFTKLFASMGAVAKVRVGHGGCFAQGVLGLQPTQSHVAWSSPPWYPCSVHRT